MKTHRRISFIMAMIMLFLTLPIGEIALAVEEPTVDKVIVTRNYRDGYRNIDSISIEVRGTKLMELDAGDKVIAVDKAGEPLELQVIQESNNNLFYRIGREDADKIRSLRVKGESYEVTDKDMPTVSSVAPENRTLRLEEDNKEANTITITGANFNKEGIKTSITDSKGTGVPGVEVGGTEITKIFDYKATLGGGYNLRFEKEKEGSLTLVENYLDLFKVQGKLNISDDIYLVPTQGRVGSEVRIIGDSLLPTNEMSVFFAEKSDGIFTLTPDNQGVNPKYGAKSIVVDGKRKDVFTVTVPPKLAQKEYYVILTNFVGEGKDPEKEVTDIYEVKDKFTVVDGGSSGQIFRVDPEKGPETGLDATIKGKNLISIPESILTPTEDFNKKIKITKPTTDQSTDSLEFTFGDGKKPIGNYQLIGEGGEVYKVERKIKGVIGQPINFYKDIEYSPAQDILKVKLLDITIPEGEDRLKDVTLQISTTYYGKEGKVLREVEEIVTWDKRFEYEKVRYEPNITKVVPEVLPVDADNKLEEGIILHILGENFLMHRFKEAGESSVKYPKINLGGQAILDPNAKEDDENTTLNGIPVFPIKPSDITITKNGVPISGTSKDNLGDKVSIKLPKDIKIDDSVIDKGAPQLTLTNPLKNGEEVEANSNLGFGGSDEYPIKFTRPEGNIPRITEITPEIITVNGYNGVIITGTGFDRDVKVYIDGEEVENLTRHDANTLEFNLPAKREGRYQILVQNQNGGMGTTEILYVETYTDIKLTDFNPKKGSEGTIVTVTGSGFVKADNAKVTDIENLGIYKLIGTRVLLGGQDINEYHRDEDGEITLQNFTPTELIKSEKGQLKVKEDYHSLIFVDKEENYYSLYYDTKVNEYKISDGHLDIYTLRGEGDKVIGNKGGTDFEITQEGSTLKIGEKELEIKTPYKVEGGKITGNKVKVIDNGELIFEVPRKAREGYYDLIVINPDTNQDSRTGNNGFYYSYLPAYSPEIDYIKPDEGSVDGGYFIEIGLKGKGERPFKGFVDGEGTDKTLVTIGGQQVPAEDVIISNDGYSLKARVPAYNGEMPEDVSRRKVTVTVVNPDGGSDSKIDGFTYVVSISNPKITNIVLNSASASGGDIVDIVGSDFRLFEPYYDGDLKNFVDLNDNEKWDDLRLGIVNIDGENKPIDSLTEEEWNKYIKPILPKVYFGDKEGEILDFDDTGRRLVVKTPEGLKGNVKVFLVNNDHGRSNEVDFTFKVTEPKINSVVPNSGPKSGGTKVEINGENFAESEINLITNDKTTVKERLQLVQFGNEEDKKISNKSYNYGEKDENGHDNSGKIENRKTTVYVDNLKVEYDATDSKNKKLNFTLTEGVGENQVEYKFNYQGYNDETLFLPLNKLVGKLDDKEVNYTGKGLIRITMEEVEGISQLTRLRVDRGFSEKAEITRPGKIELETPTHHGVEDTIVTVINPDKEKANSNFSYRNPDSKPYITNILRNGQEGEKGDGGSKIIISVPYTGGSVMEILGGDFRKPVDIIIGSDIVIDRGTINYYPENEGVSNKLEFVMPRVDRTQLGKLHRVTVRNPDGGAANSNDLETPEIPIYIMFTEPESIDMRIDNIVPNTGPTIGGTQVTIYGNDFRKEMDGYEGKNLKIYFRRDGEIIEVPASDILSITFEKIELLTPPFTAGITDVIVENPDGNQVTLENGFTYTSAPEITAVVNPENEKETIENISVKGGEKLKLKGKDFLTGAEVIFAPKLRELEDKEVTTERVITIEGRRYALTGGTAGTEIEVLDKENILVTTPEGKIGEQGVIVINPDGGVSNVYNLVYGIPEVSAPFDVEAYLVYDEFIRINWQGVRNALEYEIYVSENDSAYQFVGSTNTLNYAYQQIKPDTKYRFMVRAIGEYGSSKPVRESISNIVWTNKQAGVIDTDGGLGEKTTIKRMNKDVDIILGTKDFNYQGLKLDLTRGELAGVENVTIRIPAKIASTVKGDITVLGPRYTMKVNTSAFNTTTMKENTNNDKAGVVFTIKPYKGPIKGARILSPVYELKAESYIDQYKEPIVNLQNSLTLNLQTNLTNNRRQIRPKLSRYEGSTNWTPVKTINRMGIYAIIQ